MGIFSTIGWLIAIVIAWIYGIVYAIKKIIEFFNKKK